MAAPAKTELYSTYKTYLMVGSGSPLSYSEVCPIKSYPDLGGAPDLIDMTTLSNKSKIGVPGIQNNDAMTFEANYNPTVYNELLAYADGTARNWAVYFGASISGSTVTPDGSDGKFTFQGLFDVFVAGGGVNEGRSMTITITPTSDIAFTAPT